MQLGEFAILICARWGRRGLSEQPVRAAGDIGGEFGLTDFGEVVILDIVPLQKTAARAR